MPLSPAITPGPPIAGQLAPGQRDALYRLDGSAGQQVLLTANAFSSTSGNWTLYGPGNQVVRTAQLGQSFSVTLPGAGSYLLLLQGRIDPAISYNFTVTVTTPLQPATPPGDTAPPTGATDGLPALQPLVDAAILHWSLAGAGAGNVARLRGIHVEFADLLGSLLGLAETDRILLDRDAAGYGWFADPTPLDDSEFVYGSTGLTAPADGPASGKMDLLTVLEHELGHLLGLEHTGGDDVMAAFLPPGVRRAPTRADIDRLFAS